MEGCKSEVDIVSSILMVSGFYNDFGRLGLGRSTLCQLNASLDLVNRGLSWRIEKLLLICYVLCNLNGGGF